MLGDIGCYTLGAQPPLTALDSTLCMGASIGGVHGFNKVMNNVKSVAVIGDSTFVHSGITGLINIAYNRSNSTVLVLDNSITGMTGHQENPTTGYNIKGEPSAKIDIEALCKSIGIGRVKVIDPYNLKECERVILEELEAAEPSVIIARRPCALLKSFSAGDTIKINENCIGCKMCMKLGCPAISMKDGKASINTTLCVGCGICKQMCAVGAMESEAK